jgi:hypothetical protein
MACIQEALDETNLRADYRVSPLEPLNLWTPHLVPLDLLLASTRAMNASICDRYPSRYHTAPRDLSSRPHGCHELLFFSLDLAQ